MKHVGSKTFSAVALSMFVLWGCATIMHGTSQKIGVSSNPTGAKVSVDNANMGTTPMFADLKRGDDHIITFEMDGYSKASLTITKSVSGWVWGNILFGGLIGLAVDAITGGLYNLSPEQLNAELKKQGTSAIQKDDAIYIVTVLRPDPSWNKIGELKPARYTVPCELTVISPPRKKMGFYSGQHAALLNHSSCSGCPRRFRRRNLAPFR